MENIDALKTAASKIAKDLEFLPVQRAFDHHYSALREAREYGLPWQIIADILAQAGIRGADGAPISAKHAAVLFSKSASKVKAGKLRLGTPAKQPIATAITQAPPQPHSKHGEGRIISRSGQGLESLVKG